jgi:hypothetical protein
MFQHGSVLDRINELLKQKQEQSNEGAQTEAAQTEVTKIETTPAVSQPPFGLCRCCNPPKALVATIDRKILCPASREEYLLNVDGTVVPKPPEVNLQSTDSIETALNDGNAAFYYGGFIGGQNEEERPRRRRRR